MNAKSKPPSEFDLLTQAVDLSGADVLDLGCGDGWFARRIADRSGAASVTAMDADADQIRRNKESDTQGVRFIDGVAEALALPDATIDVIVMMKSLHHVPIDRMDAAFGEFARVLRPGGHIYISEPEYAGSFNDILKLFHDEGPERAAALAAIDRAQAYGAFSLAKKMKIPRIVKHASLAEFRERWMNLPWLKGRITPAIEQQVAKTWQTHAPLDQPVTFESNMLNFVLKKVSR